MIDTSLRSITLCIMVSIAWYFGAIALYNTAVNFSSQWHWYVLATIYTLVLNEIFLHEIVFHNKLNIDPSRWTYKIFTFLLTIDHANGPITSFCLLHSNHHQYSDKEYDIVNYRTRWYNFCILAPWIFLTNTKLNLPNKEKFLAHERIQFQTVLNDSWTQFCEGYKIPLTIFFWFVLYMLAPIILFKIIFMGRFLISVFKFLADVFGHMKLPFGYRNFNTNDTTYNHLVFHYLCLGLFTAMLHNNHHGTTSSKHSFHWYEFDMGGVVAKLLKPLLSK